jgi:hypothetical protein
MRLWESEHVVVDRAFFSFPHVHGRLHIFFSLSRGLNSGASKILMQRLLVVFGYQCLGFIMFSRKDGR